MITLILATSNAHKVAEIQAILSGGFQFLTPADLPGFPKVREDANSFAGNATKKAVQTANWLSASPHLHHKPGVNLAPGNTAAFVLADDSGLEVDALNGAPGVLSARFAQLDSSVAGNAPDQANNAKLLQLLQGVPSDKRTARFRCVIALTPLLAPCNGNTSELCYLDEAEARTEIFEGFCEGTIAASPNGSAGFGYDPLFIPVGFERSFASLREEEKNRISHRGRALVEVRRYLACFLGQPNSTAGEVRKG